MPHQSEFLQHEMDIMATSTIDHQKLATGQTAAQEWAQKLAGVIPGPQVYPLNRMFGMFIGPHGAGKSSVIQGNPDCLIINTDLTSAVIKPCRAPMWPHIGPAGTIVDVDGKVFRLTWEAIRQKIDMLVQMAKEDQPRPECVCIDSISGLITVLRDWVCRQKKFKDWSEADDKTDGSRVYEIVAKVPFELRAAGYGFWYTCGLDRETIQLTRDTASVEKKWAVSESALRRFQYSLEMVVPITIEFEKVTRPGQPAAWIGKRYADFTDPQTAGAAKNRNIEGKIFLPPNEGWQALQKAYEEANGCLA